MVSPERKKEVLGLILMVVCFLLILSILTYNPSDNVLAQRFSWDSLLSPGSKNALNALGLTGAAIARVLVPKFLGYFVLFLPLSGLAWGYSWFRHRDTSKYRMTTLLAFFSAYL